jgi:hypothetical protein
MVGFYVALETYLLFFVSQNPNGVGFFLNKAAFWKIVPFIVIGIIIALLPIADAGDSGINLRECTKRGILKRFIPWKDITSVTTVRGPMAVPFTNIHYKGKGSVPVVLGLGTGSPNYYGLMELLLKHVDENKFDSETLKLKDSQFRKDKAQSTQIISWCITIVSILIMLILRF